MRRRELPIPDCSYQTTGVLATPIVPPPCWEAQTKLSAFGRLTVADRATQLLSPLRNARMSLDENYRQIPIELAAFPTNDARKSSAGP